MLRGWSPIGLSIACCHVGSHTFLVTIQEGRRGARIGSGVAALRCYDYLLLPPSAKQTRLLYLPLLVFPHAVAGGGQGHSAPILSARSWPTLLPCRCQADCQGWGVPPGPRVIMVAADVEMSDTPAKAVAPAAEKASAAPPTAESILAGTWCGRVPSFLARLNVQARGMRRMRSMYRETFLSALGRCEQCARGPHLVCVLCFDY